MDGHRIDISKVSKKTRKIGTPSRANQHNKQKPSLPIAKKSKPQLSNT